MLVAAFGAGVIRSLSFGSCHYPGLGQVRQHLLLLWGTSKQREQSEQRPFLAPSIGGDLWAVEAASHMVLYYVHLILS